MRIAFIAAVAFLLLYMAIGGAIAATSPCAEMEWWGVKSLDGWHGDYKCYNGSVIDYR